MEMVAGCGEVSRITGCMLRYTDLIPVADGKSVPRTGDIERVLSGSYHCQVNDGQNEIIFRSTKIPGTTGSVCSRYNLPGKPEWILVFIMKTEAPAGFGSKDAVLDWFDDARGEIHELFDLIVPGEIVKNLR